MNRDERSKLYDWLENGRVDILLRKLMRLRLAELEATLPPDSELLDYDRSARRHGGADEALGILRDAASGETPERKDSND